MTVLLAGGCGGGKSGDTGADAASAQAAAIAAQAAQFASPTDQRDAVRLAYQATFGPSEALVADIQTKGREAWVFEQLQLHGSTYTLGGDARVHQNTSQTSFCDQPAYKGSNCWRDWFSGDPLVWDFYRNAQLKPDQLRQRVAYAMQQIVVVSAQSITGNYGLRNYHNRLLELAFTNWRDVLHAVAVSPVMGDYLDNVNNDKAAPNENFARELLQLFSLGPCQLNADGSLSGGSCKPVYDNDTVRNYAFALTGWTYPAGGNNYWGCTGKRHCQFYGGDMVGVADYHDTAARTLLSGVTVPQGSTTEQALDKVLDSLMAHPNTAPFICKQMIQHLVTANPSPAYVQRVVQAFQAGQYTANVPGQAQTASYIVGDGRPGDLAATVAAVLLDDEARRSAPQASDGKLRDAVLFMTGALRAANGVSDGHVLSWQGALMQQQVFYPPTVFSFFPPDYPVPGTQLAGPAFGTLNANTGFARLNYLSFLLYWGESNPDQTIPPLPDGSRGTRINVTPFESDAADPAALVDRFSRLLTGSTLPGTSRTAVINAVSAYTAQTNPSDWKTQRVKQAAWLLMASPAAQVMR